MAKKYSKRVDKEGVRLAWVMKVYKFSARQVAEKLGVNVCTVYRIYADKKTRI
ncbi:MAG: hypothetical protein WC055_02005 [Melioribacteraceae bacterium]